MDGWIVLKWGDMVDMDVLTLSKRVLKLKCSHSLTIYNDIPYDKTHSTLTMMSPENLGLVWETL